MQPNPVQRTKNNKLFEKRDVKSRRQEKILSNPFSEYGKKDPNSLASILDGNPFKRDDNTSYENEGYGYNNNPNDNHNMPYNNPQDKPRPNTHQSQARFQNNPGDNIHGNNNIEKDLRNQQQHTSTPEINSFKWKNEQQYADNQNNQWNPNAPQDKPENIQSDMKNNILGDNAILNTAADLGLNIINNKIRDQMSNEIQQSFPASLFTNSSLKIYFDVEPFYVLKKLSIIMFPFIPEKAEVINQVQYDDMSYVSDEIDKNQDYKKRSPYLPDQYIPAMAFMTYIQQTCLSLGMNNKFTPIRIFKNTTNCAQLTIFEAQLVKVCIWIAKNKSPPFFDTQSFASYKYYLLCFILIASLAMPPRFYHVSWMIKLYYCIASAFLMYKNVVRHEDIDENEVGTAQLDTKIKSRKEKLVAFALGLAAGQLQFSWLLIKLSI